MFIFFNILGILMFAAAHFAGKGVENWLGDKSGATYMLVAGSVAIISDVAYRSLSSCGHWFSPFRGGNLMFLPIWGIGLCWVGWAFAEHVFGFEKSTTTSQVVVGSVLAIMLVIAIIKNPSIFIESEDQIAAINGDKRDTKGDTSV